MSRRAATATTRYSMIPAGESPAGRVRWCGVSILPQAFKRFDHAPPRRSVSTERSVRTSSYYRYGSFRWRTRMDAIRVFFGHFEPHPVIADAEPQIAAAFQLFDLAFAARRVIGERMQDIERLSAINLPQLLLGAVGPDELTQRPNSRNTSSCDVAEPFSLRA